MTGLRAFFLRGHALSQQERISCALGARKSRTRHSSTRVRLLAVAKASLVEGPRRAQQQEARKASHRREEVGKLDLSRGLLVAGGTRAGERNDLHALRYPDSAHNDD